MKTAYLLIALCLLASLWTVNATVFEAESSEDVDLFVSENEKDTIALLFYDGTTDNSNDEDWFARLSSKILGIFMSSDQYGRSTEDWIELFDDHLHLMRIDLRNEDNLRAKETFNIVKAPWIIVRDNQRNVISEQVTDETYEKVRAYLNQRANMLNKDGGAVLKSFNLEPDANVPETKPRIIQYFDLEKGSPTNVEQPIQDQGVNWGKVDVIGPDGQWEERGRDWVSGYEIKESGISNQKDAKKVSVVKNTRDDPRGKAPQPRTVTSKKSAVPAGPPKSVSAPPQAKPKPAPTQAKPASAPAQAKPASAPAQAKPASAGPVQKALKGGAAPASSSPAQQKAYSRHPYHSRDYRGYGEFQDQQFGNKYTYSTKGRFGGSR